MTTPDTAPSAIASDDHGLALRPLRGDGERRACCALQEEIWGEGFVEKVAPGVLRLADQLGGAALGAFDGDGDGSGDGSGDGGELVGFVFGLSGFDHRLGLADAPGDPLHWSHMLGVRRGLRDRGLGLALKRFQRRHLLERGIPRMAWTFDPLEARNAHFNLHRLGARVARYGRDHYGTGGDNARFAGLGTDRFFVLWELDGPEAVALHDPALHDRPSREPDRDAAGPETAGTGWADAPVVNLERHSPRPHPSPSPAAAGTGRVRIAIPSRIQDLKERSPEEALAWRTSTRHAFEAFLGAGYRVAGFARGAAGEPRGHYLLEVSP